MNKMIVLFVVLLSFNLAGCSGDNPEAKLNAVQELLAKDIPMNEKQKSEVDKFLSEGKQLLAEGKGKESTVALDRAYKVLKYAEDAALYNKSE